MLLTIETTHHPATDLGYLLHKNPAKAQVFELAFGRAHVFYPVVEASRCRIAVLLDVDPVGLVRGRGGGGRGGSWGSWGLDQYVNDRPYVASSFLSVAINKLLSTAMNGRSKERPELVTQPLPLTATLAVVPVRGGHRGGGGGAGGEEGGEGPDLLERLFGPLGYTVRAQWHPLDEKLAASDPGGAWGESLYCTLTLSHTITVQDLLRHLYVLIPVLDNEKHYWVGEDEVEKLLARAGDWLPDHPEKDLIVRRYLRRSGRLTRDALARLAPEEDPDPDVSEAAHDAQEEAVERPLSLNRQRMESVLSVLKASGAASVLDLGCGEGTLLHGLLAERQFARIVGMDVSVRALQRASQRLRLERLPERQRARIELLHSSLLYRDGRLAGFDAAAMVEVIEHMDPPRLRALERAVFEFARPQTVVVTTPNREYNVRWETLPAGKFRHRDHRFEWARAEFAAWSEGVGRRFGYAVRVLPVGPADEEVGSPTQMGVFSQAG
jgi:3' terminal RNA ribose 2'-O-methyltransferase Hen1